jgi:uncharacterized membrane protein
VAVLEASTGHHRLCHNRNFLYVYAARLAPYYKTNTIVIGEVAGYGARIGSHFDNEAWGPFITQGVFLLVGPLFFAATIYMMLGRTIRLAGGDDVSLIKPKWYTRIFVTADVSTLIIQGFG